MIKIQNYIGGAWVDAENGNSLDNINPSTGAVYSLIPDSGEADIEKAVLAARAAFPAWSAMPVKERSDILLRIASKIETQLEQLALAESIDNGKPLKLARKVDIPRAASNFHFFATAILHEVDAAYHTDNEAINYTQHHPIGVVGCISPWNLPLYLFTWKIVPALASGNCVVAKPSEVTPMTAFLLSKICKEAGLPDGVLNIVHGTGPSCGQALVAHPEIKAISFTGGTNTGKSIAATAAPMFKKLSLELGGKNPNIIFADCDFDDALSVTLQSTFANQGQICLCGSRIFIERPIYEKFRDALVKKAAALRLGNPQEEETQVGAIVSQPHMEKVLSYIALAKEEGGTILLGGHQVDMPAPRDKGYYLAPTLIEGLNAYCRTNQEEIFGPVATLIPFDTEEEVLAYANSTTYGLSATLWTQNLKRAHRMSAALEAGIVWVNTWLLRDLRTPFGGMKQSGVGREGGFEALNFFRETKNVCIKIK